MTPLTREQVAHLVCDGGDDSAELYLQHDAVLRKELADLQDQARQRRLTPDGYCSY